MKRLRGENFIGWEVLRPRTILTRWKLNDNKITKSGANRETDMENPHLKRRRFYNLRAWGADMKNERVDFS